jgi:hypothetical protein
MAVRSWVLTVTVLVEEDSEKAPPPAPNGWRSTDDDIQKAVTAAIAELLTTTPGVTVNWESLTSTPLNDKPGVGRCAVCNRWVYDVENCTVRTPTCISRGAVVDGQLLCDEHLPSDHPYAF